MDIHEDATDEHILPVALWNKADFAFTFVLNVRILYLSLTALTHKTTFTFLQYTLIRIKNKMLQAAGAITLGYH